MTREDLMKQIVRAKALPDPSTATILHNGRVRVRQQQENAPPETAPTTVLQINCNNLVEENLTGPFDRFVPPATSFELWDLKSTGSMVKLDCCKFSTVQLHLNAYKLWKQHDLVKNGGGSFIGRLLHVLSSDQMKTLLLDRFDSSSDSRKRESLLMSDNDVSMSIVQGQDPAGSDIGLFMRLGITKRLSVKLQVVYNYFDVIFKCHPILSSRINRNPLASALMSRDCRSTVDGEYGFLTIDNARTVTLLSSESDIGIITSAKIPIFGVWIKDVGENLGTWRNYALVCKAIKSGLIKLTSGNLLLVAFPRSSIRPQFYNVEMFSADIGDLKVEKSLVIEISQNKLTINHPLIFEMNKKAAAHPQSNVPTSSAVMTNFSSVAATDFATPMKPKTKRTALITADTSRQPKPEPNNDKPGEIPSLPAHQYLKMLKDQIEFITEQLGVDLSKMESSPSKQVNANPMKETGTNTTFRFQANPTPAEPNSCSPPIKPVTTTATVQTSFGNLENVAPKQQQNTFVPLYTHHQQQSLESTLPKDKYDDEERKFIQEIPDLNGEGYTSISMKQEAEVVESPLATDEVAALLKNVDAALQNKTFDASTSFKPRPIVDSERRHSFPSSKSVAIPRLAKHLEDINDADKSFILVEENSAEYQSSKMQEQSREARLNSRPPPFQTQKTEQVKENVPLKQTMMKMKSLDIVTSSPITSPNVGGCFLISPELSAIQRPPFGAARKLEVSKGIVSPLKKTKQDSSMLSEVSSIIMDRLVDDEHKSIRSIHNISSSGFETTTYEGYSFATLDYMKRYNLL